MEEKELHWEIVKKEQEIHNVKTFWLKCKEEVVFLAGQYLTIKLPGFEPSEGKAYSIASTPGEAEVRLAVKEIGAFSKEILKQEVGNTLITTEPYGFFYPEEDDEEDLVFLVGGIGITPVISIIKQLTANKDPRKIHLYYSNQTVADIAFYNELLELEKQNLNFSLTSHVTRENAPNPHLAKRFDVAEIVEALTELENTLFFLCGSMHFTKDMWKSLREANVPPELIYTEGFF